MICLLYFPRLTVGFENEICSYFIHYSSLLYSNIIVLLLQEPSWPESLKSLNPWNPWILEIHAESPTSAPRVHDNLQAYVFNLEKVKLNVLNLTISKPNNVLTNHAESPPSELEEEQTLLHLWIKCCCCIICIFFISSSDLTRLQK